MSDIPGDLTGRDPLVAWLNKLKKAVVRRTPLPGVGYKLQQTESGFVQDIKPGGGGPSEDVSVKQVALISVSADTLSVIEVDAFGSPIGPLLVAIKPYKLRQSITSQVVDGITINYTYDNAVTRNAYIANTFVETQIVIPRYNANDPLLLVQLDGNYYDLNVDGRAWARKYV